MKQKIKTILKRSLPVVLIAVLLGIFIYNINARILLDDPMPMPLGIGSSVVLSGSMEPELSVNDLIIVKRTDRVEVGQVVVYRSGGSMTVHRIIAIEGDEIITQGDANNAPDDPITREMIKGEVILAIPLVGILIGALQNPIVTVLLLGVAVFLFERSFRKEKGKDEDELEAIKKEIREIADDLKK